MRMMLSAFLTVVLMMTQVSPAQNPSAATTQAVLDLISETEKPPSNVPVQPAVLNPTPEPPSTMSEQPAVMSGQPAVPNPVPEAEKPPAAAQPAVLSLMSEAERPLSIPEYTKKKNKLPSGSLFYVANLDDCNRGNAASCVNAANAFRNCSGVQEATCKKLNRYAELLWAKACAARSCGPLAQMLQAQGDILSVRWLYTKSNNQWALAESYATDEPRDVQAAVAIYAPLCEATSDWESVERACNKMVRLGYNNPNVTQNLARAHQAVGEQQEQNRQQRIAQLQADIPNLQAQAAEAERNYWEASSNVSGGQSFGMALLATASLTALAALAGNLRSKADSEQEELTRLEGESSQYQAERAAQR